MELRRKGYVKVPGAGPPQTLLPYSWGSHASRIVAHLRDGHEDLKLDAESFDRLVTWIDINAPYYPSYASAYPSNLHGRSPLDGKQLARLSKLTGMKLGGQSHAPLISFTRPELSPCLAKFRDRTDPRYKEALAIIHAGKEMLARRPRMDMPGARLVGIEVGRQEKYGRLARVEAAARQAIVSGEKLYSGKPPQE
jgi:hypothetical protein